LAGFAGLLAAVGYLTILRPLRRRINPLYAAVQVERTIEDPKNSVVGYVDAREREDLHPSVRTAVAARAAKSMGQADLNRAVDDGGRPRRREDPVAGQARPAAGAHPAQPGGPELRGAAAGEGRRQPRLAGPGAGLPRPERVLVQGGRRRLRDARVPGHRPVAA